MMQRLYFFLAVLFLSFTASAQTFYQVTTLSGAQTVGGNTVTVTGSGSGNTSTSWCGAGPYWIGSGNGLGGYSFSFATPVSQIRLIITAINNGDVVHFNINGANYNLNNPPGCVQISNYNPTCAGGVTGVAVIDGNGNLTVTNGAASGITSGVQVDLAPTAPITSFSMMHVAGTINGEVIGVYFLTAGNTISGCAGVSATADTPCTGGILHLHGITASTYSPLTWSWTGPGNFTSNLQNPFINGVQMSDTGIYTVTMTDSLPHTATVHVGVRQTPSTPIAGNNGPLCIPASTLNLTATSNFASSYNWSGPGGFTSALQNPTITPISLATAGLYKVWATNTNGCVSDTSTTMVQVYPQVTAAYNFNRRYGCSSDTVDFTNTSTNGVSATWYFGDGTSSTQISPTHIYTTQGVYQVKLVSRSNTCRDSVTKTVDVLHPLSASFTVDKDSVCQQGAVSFTNTSVTTTRNGISPKWLWIYGDGGTDTAQSPTHNFVKQGVYIVKLIVKDFVPCTDTAYHVIVVDSIPFVRFTISDSSICQGQAIHFLADYLHIGNTGIEWQMGDSTHLVNQDAVNHGYDAAGAYDVVLTSHYRICADTSYRKTINVRPFPGINLGPDTAICPNGAPVTLADHVGGGGSYLWSTGEMVASIMVQEPGTYYATKTLDGCATTDTVEVRKNCYTNIPNVFTPNGDGMNDYFYPRQLLSEGVTFFRMSIFNRWGQLIYETARPDGRGWDGKLNDVAQPQGVYIYRIDVGYMNGVVEKYTGNVTLLR